MLSVLTLAESLLLWLNKVISQGRVNIFAMFKKGCYYASSEARSCCEQMESRTHPMSSISTSACACFAGFFQPL